MKRSRGRFVEMIVDFFRRMRSLMQRKSWEETKLLVSSVPKSIDDQKIAVKDIGVSVFCFF